jgi:hypothetical protein
VTGDIVTERSGIDPVCPGGCAWLKYSVPLLTPFEAQANLPYYLSINTLWLVDAGNVFDVGPSAGPTWLLAGAGARLRDPYLVRRWERRSRCTAHQHRSPRPWCWLVLV